MFHCRQCDHIRSSLSLALNSQSRLLQVSFIFFPPLQNCRSVSVFVSVSLQFDFLMAVLLRRGLFVALHRCVSSTVAPPPALLAAALGRVTC